MATCNPQALPAEAKCFHCIPPDAKQVLKLYLQNTIAGTLTAAQLSAGAAAFRPLDNRLALAAKVYLLATVNGMAANAASLEAAAKCWQCIPKSSRLDVETYLWAVAAGGSLDPATLTAHIGPYKSLFPIRDQVELYLLNVAAGNLSLATIIAGAKCLICLSPARLEEIYLYLLCTADGSGVLCVDIAALLIPVITGNYNASGNLTSINILFPKVCCDAAGYGIYAAGTLNNLQAGLIPASASGTTNYQILNVDVTGIASGSGFSVRQGCADGTISGESNVLPLSNLDPAVLDWAARVVINGGAAPSSNSKVAASTFVTALRAAGIFSKFKTLNMVAPDNLIAAQTPLIVGTGLDPWPNVGAANFLAADLSAFGLHCDGTKALDTGVLGTSLSLSNAGITIIASVINPNNGLLYDMGYLNATNQEYMFVAASQSGAGQTGHSGGSSFSTGIINNTGSVYAGYISYNRTSVVRADLYYANNDIAHSSIGNNTNNQALGISATSLYFGAVHDSGGGAIPYYSKNTLSLGAVHDGLTATESLAFFNAANTLRTSFGGGYGDIGNSYEGSWLQRIAAAGGAAPSAGTLAAAHTFATSLFSGGILGKIYTANVMAPDNLIACLTPFIYKTGSASWSNNGGNLVLGDLTINGIKGNASNKWMDTGWDISTLAPTAPTDIGFSIYISQTAGAASDSEAEIGQCPASANDMYIIRGWIAANQVSGVLGLGANIIAATWAKTGWTGYASVNRLTTTSLLLFAANSITPHAQVGSNAVAPTTVAGSPTGHVFVLAANAPTFGVPNNPSSKRLSFAAIHQALALAESATLFNAIQAFRTSIGGGFI